MTKKKPLTLSELARAVERSPGFICDIFYGRRRPSIDTAKRLAEATGVPMIRWIDHDYFVGTGKNQYLKPFKPRKSDNGNDLKKSELK